MSSDTSLIFNLVARDRASAALGRMREKFDTAATGIATGVAAALGIGIAANLDMEAASDKLAAQLGVGPAEAAELSKVSASVYKNAWGDSVETVNEAIRGVYKNIGDTSEAEGGLEGITTKALALTETFDQDLNMATAAVGQMIRTGLADNADEAFDILTVGLSGAADKSGDLLETFNEYSTQFRRVGLDGQTATGLISQGLKNGARDADQVADALGQFGERALAGGTAVDEAYKSIGLNADDMAAKIGAGGESAEQALQMTMDALRGTGDEQVKLNAAAALFGDPANVMGDALFSLDPATAAASAGMDKAKGAADRMATAVGDNPKAALEKFKRSAISELSEVAGTFIQFASDNQTVMMPLAATLGGIALLVLGIKAGMIAWAAAQTLWTAATTIATGAQWLWNSAMFAWPGTWIIAAILLVIAAIVLLWQNSEGFRNVVIGVWNGIKDKAMAVGGWFKNTLWPWMRGVWNSISDGAGSMLRTIKGYWNSLVSFVTGIPGRIGKAASGMWDGIKNAFRSAVNWIIGKWNNFSFTIGGGSIMGVSIPSVTLGTPDIPYLATGGVINRGGLAMVGERGPELLHLPTGAAVSPLARGGTARTEIVVRLEAGDGRDKLLALMRDIVRVEGEGNVQRTFKPRR